jgi:uncharacterized protein (TIGR03067 family)
VLVANAVSTFIGIPLTWLAMVAVQTMLPDVSLNEVDTPWNTFTYVVLHAAWLTPSEKDLVWLVPAATLILLVPYFLISVYCERRLLNLQFSDVDRGRVARASWLANGVTYGALAAVAGVWLWGGLVKAERQSGGSPELVRAAEVGYEASQASFEAGIDSLETLMNWSVRWMRAERALADTPQIEKEAIAAHLARIEELCRRANTRDRTVAQYYLAEAQLLAQQAGIREASAREQSVLRTLQGVWVDAAAAKEPSRQAGTRVEFQGSIINVRRDGRGGWGWVKLDLTEEPYRIDATGFNDDHQFELKGIFRPGQDWLRIVWSEGREDRPTTFGPDDDKLPMLRRLPK